MNSRLTIVATVLFGWMLFAAAQQPGDLEILGHGPIHEAFAQPAGTTVDANVLVAKQPPAPVDELPPDVKPEGDHVVWLPGYWAFDRERDDFVWVSGFWRNVPPDRVWVPGYWIAEGNGFRWVGGYWSAPVQQQTYYPPPPEPIAEAVPPAPDDASFYVPGTWVYRDTRYFWRPGQWAPYRAGWMWIAPHYSWTPAGYVFVDGYWDYEFNRRGVLFAPVWFGPRYFVAQRTYRPAFAISVDFLYGSLFVGPGSRYWFGDYYAPRYANLGYVPWLDYRSRNRFGDPSWSYYQWSNRGSPRWAEQTRAAYVTRQNGTAPAPPRRIDPQAAAQAQANVNVNIVQPVRQLNSTNVKLRQINDTEAATFKKNAQQISALGEARQRVERKVDAKAGGKQPVRADLPIQRIAGAPGTAVPPPLLHPRPDPSVALPKGQTPPPPTPKTEPPKQQPPTPPKTEPPKVEPKPPTLPKTEPPKQQPPTPPKTEPPKQQPPAPPKVEPPKVQPPKRQPPPVPPVPTPPPVPVPTPKTPMPTPNVTLPQPAPNPTPPKQPPSAPPTPVPLPKTPMPTPNVTLPQPAPPPQKIAPPPAPRQPPPKVAPTPPPQPAPPPAPPPRPAPQVKTPPPAPPSPPPDRPKGKGKEKD